ncbi:MAG TPA: anti-sigma factor [Pyrinomonadaceae bacterium]
MTEKDYKENLAAHALDALDENERRELDALLAGDAQFRAEFDGMRETAAALSFAAELLEPPAEVRSRILEKIKQTPQTEKPKFTVIEGGKNKSSVKAVPTPENEFTAQAPRRSGFWNVLPKIIAVAASIAVLVLAYSLINATRQNARAQAEIAGLNQKLVEAEQNLNKTSGELAQIRAERELLASPQTIVAALGGTENSPQARARLVFDKQTGKAFLYVEGLPDAPDGKAYQIWWISDPTKPAPGGTFKTHDNGKGELRDQIPSKDLNAGVFAVTLEPEGGSDAPTSKPYLISKL